MRSASLCWLASLAALFFSLMNPFGAPALGGDHHDHYWVSQDPSVGYAVPIQRVYEFPAPFVYQPATPYGYEAPMQPGCQSPAASMFPQCPGPWFGGSIFASYDLWAGPSFVPR